MRREMCLIFQILAYVECAAAMGKIPLPDLKGNYDKDDIAYHVLLCSDAGFLQVRIKEVGGWPIDIDRMTWAGHEKLEEMKVEGYKAR